jgi:methylamine dehydrogenase accessory protein MauD
MSALAVSSALLWVAVVALSIIVLALARQIGVLHERIAPAGALTLASGIRPGEAAPDLELATLAGVPFRLRSPAERGRGLLVFFLSPTCPVCRTLLPVLKRIATEERSWLEVVLASDGGGRAEHEAYARDQSLDAFPYVLSQTLGVALGVGRLPYAALVDRTGVLAAKGLVNTREHLESLLEAERLGVADIDQYLAARDDGQGADPSVRVARNRRST